jgi:hypothetical protein
MGTGQKLARHIFRSAGVQMKKPIAGQTRYFRWLNELMFSTYFALLVVTEKARNQRLERDARLA